MAAVHNQEPPILVGGPINVPEPVSGPPETAILHSELALIERSLDGYAARWNNLRFLVSVATEEDGRRWLHASVSRDDHAIPVYSDLIQLKRLCVGEHRTALQVFPPSVKHVNLAPVTGIEVLHLWCCLDGDVTPDFTAGSGSI